LCEPLAQIDAIAKMRSPALRYRDIGLRARQCREEKQENY
jgi:hypothetical protein